MPRSTPLSKASSPPHLLTLIALTALSVLTLTMILPSLAGIADAFGADYATVNLALAGYLAMTAVVHLTSGPLSDRFGRRPVLLTGLVLFTIASCACSMAQDVWTFLIFRMIQAAIVSGTALSMVIVRDTTTARKTAGALGTISMAMAIAPMLGPMLGGVIDTAFGWRSVFHFFALAGFAMFVVCWADLGETRPDRTETPGADRNGMLILFQDRRFWPYALCTAFSTGAFFIFLTGAPLVAGGTFGVSTAEIGLYLGTITAGFMVGAFLSSRLAPRYALSTMMIAGRLVACAGLLACLVIVLAGWLSPVVYFGGTLFVGLGNGITMPSSNTGAMSVRPGLTGTAGGLNAAFNVLSGAALTSLAGLILTPANAPYGLLILMLAASAAGLLAALWARRLEKHGQDVVEQV